MKELKPANHLPKALACAAGLVAFQHALAAADVATDANSSQKPRVIVTTDGEIDDQCSMVRFLLCANEWDIEGIITSSSQYRWQGHKWPGDDWMEPYLEAYAKVHPNLVKHDPAYPSPEYLRARTVLGNVKAEGDIAEPTPGSDLIVKVLLDQADPRPVWLQAWGGVNTIARALKSIEEKHPERMGEVAAKCRLFLIWEQDRTYQGYIRPVWGKYEILTIISDQFEAIAYRWKQAQPAQMHRYFQGAWMEANILRDRGPLTALYPAHENGDFRSEGDSPAFLHTIPTGLRNMESPGWGGWGGRYVRVRENTWLDPVPVPGYAYPNGRWYGNTGWGRNSLKPNTTSTPAQREAYFKPIWRWTPALQNDFAARAAWCVKSYEEANHQPIVVLAHPADLKVGPGAVVRLNAKGTSDPDGDELTYHWWQYDEADTYAGAVEIQDANCMNASFAVPANAAHGNTIHIICEVTDSGAPPLTRYQRVVVRVDNPPKSPVYTLNSEGRAEIPPMTAHFPLDGGNGAVVTETVHGLQGKLINADPAVAWISGVVDGAVHLDGRAARIIVPHHEAFDFGNESFSISFWMRWPKGLPPRHQRLLTKGDYDTAFPGETGKRYELFIGSGNLRFTIDDDIVASRLNVPLAPFITGEWGHVATVRDRQAGRLKLYANGVLLPTSNSGNPGLDGTDHTGSISNPRALYIGDATREDNPFHGGLDDFRFFRSALTDQQVAAIAARAPLVEKAVAAPARTVAVSAPAATLPPLSAHFPLNEGRGTVISDAVSGAKGTLENVFDPAAAWASSDRGMALRLDGVAARAVVPHHPAFDFADESFAVSFWMRWTKPGNPHSERLLTKGDYSASAPGETGKRWELHLSYHGSAPRLRFNIDDDVNKSQIQVPFDAGISGEWIHVVAVRDTKARRLHLYVNGELQNSTDPTSMHFDGVDRTGSIANPRELFIGDASRRDNPFPGELSDIRVYRSALDDAEVAAVARLRPSAAATPVKAGPSPALPENAAAAPAGTVAVPAPAATLPPLSAHFPLNEGRGTMVTNAVGGAVGQLTNADDASWSPSPEGIALQLDGIDQRVIVPNSPGFDFADESFSVSFHVRWKKGDTAHHQHFLCKGDYSTDMPGETGIRWEINIRSRGFSFIVDDNTNKSAIQVSGAPILASDWVHVVAVRDRQERRLKLYFNGELQESNESGNEAYNGTDRTGSISNPRELVIGDSSRRDNPLAGEIADVRIFPAALTEVQVAGVARLRRSASANPGLAKPLPSVPRMSAHFPLDEGQGTAVTDVINGVEGELVNADTTTSWIPGKIGGALRLDGINDRVFVPHHPGFDFADESFSVSFWMRWPQGREPYSERFFTKGDYDSSAPGQTGKRWELFISNHENMTFVIDDGGEVSSRLKVPLAPYITGEWAHVVAVRDKENRQLRLYANGVLQKSIDPDHPRSNGIDVTGNISNPQRLTIGDAYVLDAPFEGDLDDIRIYRSALTEQQIAAVGSLAVQAR